MEISSPRPSTRRFSDEVSPLLWPSGSFRVRFNLFVGIKMTPSSRTAQRAIFSSGKLPDFLQRSAVRTPKPGAGTTQVLSFKYARRNNHICRSLTGVLTMSAYTQSPAVMAALSEAETRRAK